MATNNKYYDPTLYMGNPNLPSATAEFEYTPEMIKEIALCNSDMLHFAENYFFITTIDEGKKQIKLYSPQKRVLRTMVRDKRIAILSSRQSGKCLFKDSKIKIRNVETLVEEELTISQFHDALYEEN